MSRIITSIVFALICITNVLAQTKPAKIWATATFNKSEVQLGEPLVVTVTVYTSTWFTDPPIFEEIQVKGSLMAKLEQRNSATSVTIGRKQYPAIKQRFVIYPNVIGKNTLPQFKVITTCPPEGGYKGIKRDVYSKERTFTVLAPPENVDPKTYLASYNVTINDQWNTDFKNLKAGDVLERRISISASGALAAAIPPISLDSVPFGSIYIKPPQLVNRQNTNSFSGVRTENVNYLLEKDGAFTIPPIQINWFNLRKKAMDSVVVNSVDIAVADNPDLSFIISRQKELQQELAESQEEVEENKPSFELFGLNWWQLLLILLFFLALLRLVTRLIKKFNLTRRDRRKEQLESESHYFKQLKKSINGGSSQDIIRNFYAWYDRYRKQEYGPQISELIVGLKDPSLINLLREDIKLLYSTNNSVKLDSIKQLIELIDANRSPKFNKKSKIEGAYLKALNP